MAYHKYSVWGAIGKKIGNISLWARAGVSYSRRPSRRR
jgi:hypothetical protein